MSFTSAATTELAKYHKQAEFVLELRNGWTAPAWAEYQYMSFTLTHARGPSILSVQLPHDSPPAMSDESDQDNCTQLEAEARLTAIVGAESEVIFQGPIKKLTPKDYGIGFEAADWTSLILECECEITMNDGSSYAPDEIEAVAAAATERLYLVDGSPTGSSLGLVYGLDVGDVPDAFNDDGDRRRAWVPGGTRIYYDSARSYEVSSKHYKINYESGAVSILERGIGLAISMTAGAVVTVPGNVTHMYVDGQMVTIEGSSGAADDGVYTVQSTAVAGANTDVTIDPAPPAQTGDGFLSHAYYIENLRCYKESKAGGTNCDYAHAFKEALIYPAADGGPGLSAGDLDIMPTHAVTGVDAGADEFVIAGDYTRDFHAGIVFEVTGSTNNDGWFTSTGATYDGSDTTISVAEDVGAVADGTITLYLGIDCGSVFYYRGKIKDFFDRIAQQQQANIVYWFEPRTGKHTVRLIYHKASGAEDLDLIFPISIDQARNTQDFYTRVVCTGSSELPLNMLCHESTTFTVEAGAAGFFEWTKTNGGSDCDFQTAMHAVCNGHTGHGMGFDGQGDGMGDWSACFKATFDQEYTLDRVIAHLPPSANPNQNIREADNGDVFWPGVHIEGSVNDVDYYPISPLFDTAIDKPGSKIDADKNELTRPKAKYLKITLYHYKQGISNGNDPACGLMELEVYASSEYRIVKEIYPTEHAITVSDAADDHFTIAGDYTAIFEDGMTIQTWESNDDGTWEIGDVVLNGANTELYVTGDITSAVAAGYLAPCYMYTDGTVWCRAALNGDADAANAPDLWTRMGSRFKTHFINLGSDYNEFLAHDVALLDLVESLRLFQAVTYVSVCDPRVRMWDTVGVTDELNGDVGSILVDESLTITPNGTTITGTNYLSTTLGEQA